jgi:hypothetical protein
MFSSSHTAVPAADSAAGFLAAWMNTAVSGYSYQSVTRLFDAGGDPVTAEAAMPVVGGVNPNTWGPSPAAAPGGGFVATYTTYGSVYDPDGQTWAVR